MNTRKLRKAILTLCSALLLVSLSVGATLAYLTSQDSVTNTFTVGQVKIDLDEADVYEIGDDVDESKLGTAIPNADRVEANKYKIMPGHDLYKDPTVHVKAKSEDCYVRTFVTVNNFKDLKTILGINDDNAAAAKIATYVKGYDGNKWNDKGWIIKDDEVTYEFWWSTKVEQNNEKDQDLMLFTGINVPDTLTNEQIALLADDSTTTDKDESLQIKVIAQAIQADGFAASEDGTKTAMDVAWENWTTRQDDDV